MWCSLKETYIFNKHVNTLRVKVAKRVRKTNKSPEDYQEQEATRGMKIQRPMKKQEIKKPGHLQESGSLQESKKAAKSQESRNPRVWKTGLIGESKPRRTSPNTTMFPPTRGGEAEKGKRDTSRKSMVKLSDDSSWLSLHP
jgi:hypothetical protein